MHRMKTYQKVTEVLDFKEQGAGGGDQFLPYTLLSLLAMCLYVSGKLHNLTTPHSAQDTHTLYKVEW